MSNKVETPNQQPDYEADNVTSIAQKAALKEQAARWVMLLDRGDLSQEEISELRSWVASSALHAQYLQRYAHDWDAMQVLEVVAELLPLTPDGKGTQCDVGNTAQEANRKTQSELSGGFASAPRPTSLMQKLRMPVYAAATLGAIAVMVTMFFEPTPIDQALYTAVGEQTRHELDDGSIITLNTNSLVNVDYSDSRRKVTLLRGEANFDVAKNKQRPFVVYAGGGFVWAVGTAFNVRINDNDIDVTVTEGVVKVFADVSPDAPEPELTVSKPQSSSSAPKAREAVIKAGQSIQYSQVVGVVAPTMEEAVDEKLAWQQGALIFEGETLEQVIAEISRYTKKELVIADPSIKDTLVGGHYKTDNIDRLLLTLSIGFELQLEHTDNNRILITSK
jgi:transmembrane sensor